MGKQNKTVRNLVLAVIGAFVVYIMGDAFTYDPAELDTDEEGVGFSEDSMAGNLIVVLPAIVLALGVLKAFEFV